MVVPLHGYHLHRSSVAETQHGHLASHPYHGLAIAWVGLLGDERQHGPPQLAVHEDPPWEFTPTRLLTVPTSPIIPSLPVMVGLPLRERKEPKTPKSTPPMSIATTTRAPSNTPE